MNKYISSLIVLSLIFVQVLGCGGDTKSVAVDQPTDLNIITVANKISKGVGLVGRTNAGKNATPIVVFEENHASRAGQIQQAIAIERLRKEYDLRHIALEGYLKDREKLSLDWYDRASKGDQNTRIRVAINFLKEGEISCAEFMGLVYDELQIFPIEVTEDYAFDLSEEASAAPILYLIKIAEQSLSQNQIRTINDMQSAMERLPEGEVKNEKVQEMMNYILECDPWVHENSKMLRDEDVQLAMTTQEMVKAYEEIADRGRPYATSEERKAMEEHIQFSRGRAAADDTMAAEASALANREDAKLVAMIIGALHTDPVCNRFDQWNRPFAVITPLSFKEKDRRGDLPYEMYERKYDKLPVHSQGFSKVVFDEFGKKPEPVVNQKWFQANAEIRLFTDRIVQGILADDDGGGAKKPPYGFSNDEFNGEYVSIDVNQIEVVSDDPAMEGERLLNAVLFPVQFKTGRKIWIKAALDKERTFSKNDKYDVEVLLIDALEDVKKDEPSSELEDDSGRMRFTLNTIVVCGTTKHAASLVRVLN